MLVAFESKVSMNLVRNDNDIVVGANFSHTHKLFAQPHTTTRIVRVAQKEKFALFHFLLKILKVNLILSIN